MMYNLGGGDLAESVSLVQHNLGCPTNICSFFVDFVALSVLSIHGLFNASALLPSIIRVIPPSISKIHLACALASLMKISCSIASNTNTSRAHHVLSVLIIPIDLLLALSFI